MAQIKNSFLKNQPLYGLLLIFFINSLLYFFISFYHGLVPFDKFFYLYGTHHFYKDARIDGGSFQLLRALGRDDGQWYLKIAQEGGYPKNPINTNLNDKNVMDGLTYNFFPFYPLCLRVFNVLFNNLELTAFVFSNIMMAVSFISFYWVGSKLFDKNIALKSSLLLFFFPYSIFFRGYMTESLQLLLLLWFSFFLIKKRYLPVAITLGLLLVTKGNCMLLFVLFEIFLIKDWYQKKLGYLIILLLTVLALIPLLIWLWYNFSQTGNPLYFYSVRSAWPVIGNIFLTAARNICILFIFPALFLTQRYVYGLVGLFMLICFFLIKNSQKFLPTKLWLITSILFFTPILFTSMDSFTRYQLVFFPLFFYLAHIIKGRFYILTLSIFVLGLFIASLYYVNWYWIG